MDNTTEGFGVEVLMRPSIDPDEQAKGIQIFRSATFTKIKSTKRLEEFAVARGLNYKMISHGAIELAALIRELAFCGIGAHVPELGFIAPVVSGKADPNDPDWLDKIKVSYRIRLEKSLQTQIGTEAKIRIQTMKSARPEPREISRAVGKPAFDGVLEPNENIMLKGYRLKFNPENPDEGVFFRSEGSPTVRAEPGIIRDRSLVFGVPEELEKGRSYWLYVRAKLFRCKDVREAVFPVSITIAG